IVETRRRIGDADHGLRQHRTRVAHGLREGAAEIEREIAVAVLGETVLQPVRRFSHPCIPRSITGMRLGPQASAGEWNVSLVTPPAPLLNRARIWLRHPCETGAKGCPCAAFFCSCVIELKTRGVGPRALPPRQEPWNASKKELGSVPKLGTPCRERRNP